MTGGEGCGENDPDPNKPSHCPGQTEHEYRTEGATYSISASPMMVGTDIRLMTPVMEQVLLNPTIIAINQDSSPPGSQITSCGNEAWARKLANGSIAVAVGRLGCQVLAAFSNYISPRRAAHRWFHRRRFEWCALRALHSHRVR